MNATDLEADILRTWIAERRAILQREGCAVRAGTGNTIEVQLINTGRYGTITLPNGRTHCDTAADRDAILAQLQAPQLPPAPAQRVFPYVRHHLAHL